jgi:hypothetical protein
MATTLWWCVGRLVVSLSYRFPILRNVALCDCVPHQYPGVEQSPEVVRLRSKLVEVFQERMQLQRSIIDLQSQNVQNTAEVNRRCVRTGCARFMMFLSCVRHGRAFAL